jgi:predicted PurR-regulated permease PerM
MNSELNKELEKELVRIKGQYQAKYGKVMDEFEAILHNEIRENFQELNQNIVKASGQIKGQVKQVSFKDWKQAMGYGFGLASPFLIAVLVVSMLAFILVFYSNNYADKLKFIGKYKNAKQLENFIRDSKIAKKGDANYLILNKNQCVKGKDKNQILVKLSN